MFQRSSRFVANSGKNIRYIIEGASEIEANKRELLIKDADLMDLEDMYEQLKDSHLDNFLLCYASSFKYPSQRSRFVEVLKKNFIPNLEYQVLSATAPTTVLDQIVEYESNHPIISVHDLLEHRFTGNKLIYCASHPLLGDRVLGYLKIALDDKVACNVEDLLSKSSTKFDIANFYSIISPHLYLSQLGIGHDLITNAVHYLTKRYNTSSFYTLSPIPKFSEWQSTHKSTLSVNNDKDLKELAVKYITKAKKGKFAHCPVANFHLQNGACLFQVNLHANSSKLGIRSSFGTMVNYEYDLKKCPQRATEYQKLGKIVNKVVA